MRCNTLGRLAIGGLLGTVLTLGTAVMPARPAYAACSGGAGGICVTATSVTPYRIEIYWQMTLDNTDWDYFNVRCCRGLYGDPQYEIDSHGAYGSWGEDTEPDHVYVFKVQACMYADPLHVSGSSCTGFGELRVQTPPAPGGNGGSGGLHGSSDPNGQLAAGSQPAPSLDFGPDTCPQGLVWRESFAGDHVCVTPQQRAQAKGKGNQQDIH